MRTFFALLAMVVLVAFGGLTGYVQTGHSYNTSDILADGGSGAGD